jgi:SAM-dependent methyltransferase
MTPFAADDELRRRLHASGYDDAGFAVEYDRYRPRPPAALLDLLPPLADVERPRLVVDLGSGTGLSTRPWAARAEEVVGIEPAEAMRRYAARSTEATNVRYLARTAYDTGLPEACADIVTAAQSLQWMRRERVLPEIARLLRPGGVFCAYNYVALQTALWDPESAFETLRRRTGELRARLGLDRDSPAGWPEHEWLEAGGTFRHARELALHGVEQGDGARLVGFALSEGSLRTLLAAGVGEEEVGLDRLREVAAAIHEPVRWWISYRVLVGAR